MSKSKIKTMEIILEMKGTPEDVKEKIRQEIIKLKKKIGQ